MRPGGAHLRSSNCSQADKASNALSRCVTPFLCCNGKWVATQAPPQSLAECTRRSNSFLRHEPGFP